MGCFGSRSQNEQVIADYFDSLPIRQHHADHVANEIAEIKKACGSDITEFAKKVHEKFLISSKFDDKVVFDFLNLHGDRHHSACGLLLLCKKDSEKFKVGVVKVLEAYGFKKESHFDSEWKTNFEFMNSVLSEYVEMISLHAAKHLKKRAADANTWPELEASFHENHQKTFIKRHLVEENKKVCFNTWLNKSYDHFEECHVRDHLVEIRKVHVAEEKVKNAEKEETARNEKAKNEKAEKEKAEKEKATKEKK